MMSQYVPMLAVYVHTSVFPWISIFPTVETQRFKHETCSSLLKPLRLTRVALKEINVALYYTLSFKWPQTYWNSTMFEVRPLSQSSLSLAMHETFRLQSSEANCSLIPLLISSSIRFLLFRVIQDSQCSFFPSIILIWKSFGSLRFILSGLLSILDPQFTLVTVTQYCRQDSRLCMTRLRFVVWMVLIINRCSNKIKKEGRSMQTSYNNMRVPGRHCLKLWLLPCMFYYLYTNLHSEL